MDIIQDWADSLLGDDMHPALRLLAPYTRQVTSTIHTIQSLLAPLIDQILHKPDLTTIALLVIILFVSLQILNMLWRTFVFWLRMAVRIVFWGGAAMLAMWLYTRGAEGVVDDVQYWFRVWKDDYDYWLEKERLARTMSREGLGGGRRGDAWDTRGAAWF